jgi:hypothetical protein
LELNRFCEHDVSTKAGQLQSTVKDIAFSFRSVSICAYSCGVRLPS